MREIHTAMERRNAEVLQNVIIKMIKARTFIGFATEGNTGEDVFLACYHPKGTVLKGMVTNTDVNKYMCRLMEIESLADSTRKYFAGHKTLFPADQYDVLWDKKDAMPSVIVKSKKSKKMLSMAAFNNKAILSIPGKKKQIIQLKTVIVYIDKNEEFYLPNTLKNLIE